MRQIKLVLLNIIYRYTALLLCSTVLVACNSTKPTTMFKPLHVENTKSVIYIYRPESVANIMYSPDLYINDEYRASIKSGKHYQFTVDAGDYRFKLDRDDKISGNTLSSKRLNAGSVYYYRIDTTLKLNSASQYQPYQREFIISAVEAAVAEQQITECCLQQPSSIAVKNKETKSNPEFSVDKTQNPFSH